MCNRVRPEDSSSKRLRLALVGVSKRKQIHLNLSHNNITELEETVFTALTKLQDLRLKSNSLTENLIKNLEVLDISCNSLKILPGFESQQSLRELIDRNHFLRVIAPGKNLLIRLQNIKITMFLLPST